jgi:imidazolonepropionase-like amidohydrolase
MERIEVELLIPGRGEPMTDAVVILDTGTIAYSGGVGGAPPPTAGDSVTSVPVVLPGLWDCHGHLSGVSTFDWRPWVTDPPATRGARCAHDLQAALAAGVTSIREVGGLGVYLAQLVDEGLIDGPAIYGAGAILATTGGHADIHGFPQAWMTGWWAQSGGDFRQCDGVDDCMRAVREQLRKNAKLIKVCASGGVLSQVDDPIHQQFTAPELRAMVEVAGMADRIVAAHCHGKPGIMAALEAGVRTIEHGTYLDDEACDAMRESGAILVPTRTVMSEALDADLPPPTRAKLAAIADRHAAAVALAHDRGVTIAMGTDIGLTGPDAPNSWGRNGRELPLLVEAGLTPLEAIEAATANGPLTLGPQAPSSGVLDKGYAADVIALDADPLNDITVMADPAHVIAVWRGGRRVKPPGSPPSATR